MAAITLSFDDHNGAPNLGTYVPGSTFSFDIASSIYTITIVPEPGTLALCFAGGLSILVAYQRRKSRS